MKEADSKPGHQGKILIVEDDLVSSFAMSLMLKDYGFTIADNIMSADNIMEDMKTHLPDYILMDIRIHGKIDGIQASQLIREAYETPIVFISAFNDEATKSKVQQIRNSAFIDKPYEISQIVSTLERFGD